MPLIKFRLYAHLLAFWAFCFVMPKILFAQKTKFEMFRTAIFQTNTTLSLPYRLLEPLNYQASAKDKKYPLLICLHGAGERGTDNEITLTHFAEWLLKDENRKNFPCFGIIPQCDKNFRWVETDWTLMQHTQPKEMSKYMQALVDLLTHLEQTYPIDQARIYITGLSMGGFGTWDILSRLPNKFAAAVPVCGGADESTAEQIKHIPIWAFHGAEDKLVKPQRSRNMINALQKVGAKPRYTEYAGVGHDSWKKAYQEHELMQWIFQHKRR